MELKDISYYFDLSEFEHRDLFSTSVYVFDFMKLLEQYIGDRLRPEIRGDVMDGAYVSKDVFLGKGSVVQHGAWVRGPAIIGRNCEIRHGAYVGANTLIGDNVVIGHDSEVSNSVFLNGARAPHFAFVGHSALGNNVNLGAGTKLSNFKITSTPIKIGDIDTGLLKFGAVIGDNSSLGCNTVTQPATFIGKYVYGYPLALLRGFIPSRTIIKVRQTQETGHLRL